MDTPQRWIAVLCRERGAILWLPALGIAAWLVLFAIQVAPQGGSLFTRMTSLHVVVLPRGEHGGDDAATMQTALRRRLAEFGDIAVVDSARVAARGGAIVSAAAAGDSSLAGILTAYHAQYALDTDVARDGDVVFGRLRTFDLRRRVWLPHVTAVAAQPDLLGTALADSLRGVVFAPRTLTARLH